MNDEIGKKATTSEIHVRRPDPDDYESDSPYISIGTTETTPGVLPALRATHGLAVDGSGHGLVAERRLPIDENPVSAYLAGLAESSRRPMRTNLETIARLVSGNRASAMELAWWRLRYQHTSLIRSALAESYAPATANLMLSAMRGVLKACFRLGYTTADDFHRDADVPPVRSSLLPPGRSIELG